MAKQYLCLCLGVVIFLATLASQARKKNMAKQYLCLCLVVVVFSATRASQAKAFTNPLEDVGAEKEEKNSMGPILIDILLAEIYKTFAAAVCKVILEAACKHGKRILNSLRGKSDNEGDDGLEENLKRLTELAGLLSLKRDYIVARAQTKLLTQVCKDWIFGVTQSVKKVHDLETEYKTQSQHGSNRSSRDLISRSMTNMCMEQRYFLELEPEIRLQVGKLPERVLRMPKPQSEDEPFLHPNVEKILCELKGENVKTIGLWGEQKMGKTTIMQSLNNNEDTANMFDIVIWVTVSEDLSSEKLHYIIANRLKLIMEGITSSDEIYHKICQELESKRCLLLLDEASGSFHSSLIAQYGNAKDIKVVLTARTKKDCLEMGVDHQIPVEPMSDSVAWEFFKEKVGAQKINSLGVQPIAELVAQECAGVPSLIDKVARKFRRRDSYDLWQAGYESLQNWSAENIDDIDQLL